MWLTIRQLVEQDHGLLTTQYLEEADRLADEIAILHGGGIVASGTPDELKAMVPTELVELEFGEEAQVSAARALGEQHEVGRVDSKLVIATTGSVAEMADVFIRLKEQWDRADRVLPASPDAGRRVLQAPRRRGGGSACRERTWTMTKRSLRHTTRSLDTIITVVLTPIALLLLFVYVFGGALGEQTGSIEYVDFIAPRSSSSR